MDKKTVIIALSVLAVALLALGIFLGYAIVQKNSVNGSDANATNTTKIGTENNGSVYEFPPPPPDDGEDTPPPVPV